ncbi:MAG TPA: hypothetical protein DDX71_00095 [Ruminococcus sp.]|nr:hypothetical protein [Ruminococcus sp.]
MAKSKKSKKRSGKKQNSGGSRQRRQETQTPRQQTSSKPAWLRIAIIAVMAIMFLGVALMPFLR